MMQNFLLNGFSAGEVISVVSRTLIIFIYTFIVIRSLGKKRLSQFSIFDLILLIAFGSAVGDVMIYPERTASILASMIAIGTIVILIKLYDELSVKMPKLQSFLEGDPVILVRDGVVDESRLEKENITRKELLSFAREKGHSDLSTVKKAILEPNGEISFQKQKSKTKSVNLDE